MSFQSRRIRALCTVLCLSLLSACIPSLHPIYDADDLTAFDGISGNWDGPGGIIVSVFDQEADGRYRVTYVNQHDEVIVLRAGFTQIGQQMFADLSPVFPARLRDDDIVAPLLQDVHTALAVDLSEDQQTLIVRSPSLGWLISHLGEAPQSLPHTVTDSVLLTAETEGLRAFIAEHPALFDTSEFRLDRRP